MRQTVCILTVFSCLHAAASADIPWPEHPRPDFERSPWVNLNGPWAFAFDPKDAGLKAEWYKPGVGKFDKTIIVPFPWESELSGIHKPEYKGVAWYAREVELPSGPGWEGRDAWLVVGACDFETKVWVNGRPAVEHVGGYVPFEVNLSQFGKPGDRLHVVMRVVDLTDWEQPIGKQVDRWYTRTSGIWQTVYIEPRSPVFIRAFRTKPYIKAGTILYELEVNKDAPAHTVVISSPDGAFEPVGSAYTLDAKVIQVLVKVREPRLWSPESPTLYPVLLTLRDVNNNLIDEFRSYFGLSEFSVGKAPNNHFNHIQLNGKPVYLLGALHQSFHPKGIYQYPDDAAVRADYEIARQVGLNFLRIHIKIPTPRELYWADKLGLLIMEDMPSFWRYTPRSQRWWQEMTEAAIARDRNHPSVFSWVLFNESWGLDDGEYRKGYYNAERQAWVARMYWWAKKIDPDRLIEDNSPCHYDHVITDINSWHFYINDYAKARDHIADVVDKTYPGSSFNYAKGYRQADAPLINSEYGGIGARSGDQDVSWCFKFLTNELRRHAKIGGYVYTELSDIEWEHNGFVNYDRTPKEFGYDFWFPGFTLADLNSADFVALDAPPVIELSPMQDREVGVRVSHWSDRKAANLAIRWRVDWLDRFGRRIEGMWEQRPAVWQAFDVVEQPAIRVTADHPTGELGALLVELADGDRVLARNYVNTLVNRGPLPRVEAMDAFTLDLRVSPADYAAYTFAGPLPMGEGAAGQRIAGRGAGAIEYRIQMPANLRFNRLKSMTVLAEAASSAGDAKLDWPELRNDSSYPQTEARKWPSEARLTLNGHEVSLVALPDDPADAAGSLSHLRGYRGAHGQLVELAVPETVLTQLRVDLESDQVLRVRWEVPANANHAGGLSLYGEELGAYPVPLTVRVVMDGGHGLGERFATEVPVARDRVLAGRRVLMASDGDDRPIWRYRTDAPGREWADPDFRDGGWKTGRGVFGSEGLTGVQIGEPWNTSDIWLRTDVTVEDPKAIFGGQWRILHDEDVEVYLNGRQVFARKGLSRGYLDFDWTEQTIQALRKGRNVVAVHCRNGGGSQGIDLGASIIVAQPPKPATKAGGPDPWQKPVAR